MIANIIKRSFIKQWIGDSNKQSDISIKAGVVIGE